MVPAPTYGANIRKYSDIYLAFIELSKQIGTSGCGMSKGAGALWAVEWVRCYC